HDVAPVAGRITDRQEDGFVLCARGLQRFLSPRIPVDRIARVLLQIRACFPCEAVSHDDRETSKNQYSIACVCIRRDEFTRGRRWLHAEIPCYASGMEAYRYPR